MLVKSPREALEHTVNSIIIERIQADLRRARYKQPKWQAVARPNDLHGMNSNIQCSSLPFLQNIRYPILFWVSIRWHIQMQSTFLSYTFSKFGPEFAITVQNIAIWISRPLEHFLSKALPASHAVSASFSLTNWTLEDSLSILVVIGQCTSPESERFPMKVGGSDPHLASDLSVSQNLLNFAD